MHWHLTHHTLWWCVCLSNWMHWHLTHHTLWWQCLCLSNWMHWHLTYHTLWWQCLCLSNWMHWHLTHHTLWWPCLCLSNWMHWHLTHHTLWWCVCLSNWMYWQHSWWKHTIHCVLIEFECILVSILTEADHILCGINFERIDITPGWSRPYIMRGGGGGGGSSKSPWTPSGFATAYKETRNLLRERSISNILFLCVLQYFCQSSVKITSSVLTK